MKTALIAVIAAIALSAAEVPKPTPTTPEERSALTLKSAEQLSNEVQFLNAQIEGLKAQLAKYEELLAQPATRSHQAAAAMIEQMRKDHNAANCDPQVDGGWNCAKAPKK
jgi:hypothetical protein